MGRSSDDATKASLIRWARAARFRRVAGLTYFLCPFGVVARFVADAVFFEVDGVVVFFEVVFVADDFVLVLLEELSLAVGVVSLFAGPLDFGVVSSPLFPSAGITAKARESTAASTRAEVVAGKGERTDCIFPM